MKLVFLQLEPTLSDRPPYPVRDRDVPYDPKVLDALIDRYHTAYLRLGQKPRAFAVGRQVYVSLKATLASREERGDPGQFQFIVGRPDEHPWLFGLPVYLDPEARDDSVVVLTGLEGLRGPSEGSP